MQTNGAGVSTSVCYLNASLETRAGGLAWHVIMATLSKSLPGNIAKLLLNCVLNSYAELLAEMHAQTSAAVDATVIPYVLSRSSLSW